MSAHVSSSIRDSTYSDARQLGVLNAFMSIEVFTCTMLIWFAWPFASVSAQLSPKAVDSKSFSAEVLKSAELIHSIISVEEGGLYSSTSHEVAGPVVGSVRTYRIRLENKTGKEFAFAKSSQQCNCVRMEPEEGSIPAGESFDVVIQVRVPGRIASNKMESTIFLGLGTIGSPTHLIRLGYAFPEYVGFPVSLVELRVTNSQLSTPLEFKVPLVFGGNIPVEDIDVILGQSDTLDRPGFAFTVEGDVLHGRLDLSKTSLTSGGDRITVNMIIGRKSNDQIESIPIVVEKIDEIRIFPKLVTFKQSPNGEWKGTMHLRCQDSFSGGAVENWSCSAVSNKTKLPVELLALGKNIGKATVTLPKDFRLSPNASALGSEKVDIFITVKADVLDFKLKVFGIVSLPVLEKTK